MGIENAKRRWQALLGEENARFNTSARCPYERATFATDTKVSGVLRVKSKQHLQQALIIANKESVPVYPLSTGKNYGYGSSVPTCNGAVVIDLSALNQIIRFDKTHGTLTVQPGVTFEQVYQFLKEQGADFSIAGTGSTPASSLIGNTLERGIGKGLASNRVDNICNLEVVLPNGQCIHTGLSRFVNAKGKDVTKFGPGPFFDGIFTQSNFGVVTEMTFWLTPTPKAFTTFVYTIKDETKLPEVIDALRFLKQRDILRSSTTLFNDHRILGYVGEYPWDLCDGNRSLTDEEVKTALQRSLPIASKWYGDGALFCHSRAQARAEIKLIKKALSGLVSNLIFFRRPYVTFASKVLTALSKFSGKSFINPIEIYFNKSLYLGHPLSITQTLGSTYIRKKMSLPNANQIDPDKDQCGTYWMGPIVPFEGSEIAAATKIIKDVITAYGYEPAMTLQCVSARQIDIITSISFDREISGEDEKAKACHDELLKKLCLAGYYPYRLGNQSQHLLPAPNDDYLQFTTAIKHALDPNNILSPGRYDFKKQAKRASQSTNG
ncbi:FAD-binding oxidoreductase [Pseudoalteromonas luteoviolacea]|uniref:FAD-binding oxidoreductase n=1 Tax=Pseudoalteromonas luteoviolacea TaxID=43657 RepID=UPI00114FF851|nr:FAD-binding oxidoreductase [Pseudoalteromonas luteoviolacea]TQF72819.1 FAD-binding oxidoreductase [Pseudoalteromonas luteoviolacea]